MQMIVNAKKALQGDYTADLDNEYEVIGGKKPVRLKLREAVLSVVRAMEAIEKKAQQGGIGTLTDLSIMQAQIVLDGTFDTESDDLNITVINAVVKDFLSVYTCGRL